MCIHIADESSLQLNRQTLVQIHLKKLPDSSEHQSGQINFLSYDTIHDLTFTEKSLTHTVRNDRPISLGLIVRLEDMNLPAQPPKAFPHVLRPRVGVRLPRLHQLGLGQLGQTTQSTSPCLPLACLFYLFKLAAIPCHNNECFQTGLVAHKEKVGSNSRSNLTVPEKRLSFWGS